MSEKLLCARVKIGPCKSSLCMALTDIDQFPEVKLLFPYKRTLFSTLRQEVQCDEGRYSKT
jgi:hypothetical protein